MPIVEKMPDAPFEVWHDGVLIAIVYDDRILMNSAEDVEIVFGEQNAWLN